MSPVPAAQVVAGASAALAGVSKFAGLIPALGVCKFLSVSAKPSPPIPLAPNPLSATWRIYLSSKWSSQWPYDGYIRHGGMTSCGRGRGSATPECFGRGSQGTIFVRSSKLSLFFPELCSFRRVFLFPALLQNLAPNTQWPIGYGIGLRIKRSSVRIRPWPLRWVLGQGSLLQLSQGEAFTLASISYLAILVKYILAKQKKKKKKKKKTFEPWGFWFRRCLRALFENCAPSLGIFLRTPTTTTSIFWKILFFFRSKAGVTCLTAVVIPRLIKALWWWFVEN